MTLRTPWGIYRKISVPCGISSVFFITKILVLSPSSGLDINVEILKDTAKVLHEPFLMSWAG